LNTYRLPAIQDETLLREVCTDKGDVLPLKKANILLTINTNTKAAPYSNFTYK